MKLSGKNKINIDWDAVGAFLFVATIVIFGCVMITHLPGCHSKKRPEEAQIVITKEEVASVFKLLNTMVFKPSEEAQIVITKEEVATLALQGQASEVVVTLINTLHDAYPNRVIACTLETINTSDNMILTCHPDGSSEQ